MKNRGVTLVELLVAIVISGVVLLAAGGQFVAEEQFRFGINDQIAAENEAAIVMRYLTRIFRFAKPPVATAVGWPPWSESVSATIEGGHLSDMPDDTVVGFGRIKDSLPSYDPNTPGVLNVPNTFSYNKGGVNYSIIANNISDFHVVWDSVNRELTFQVTATITRSGGYSKSSSLESKIYVLGS